MAWELVFRSLVCSFVLFFFMNSVMEIAIDCLTVYSPFELVVARIAHESVVNFCHNAGKPF